MPRDSNGTYTLPSSVNPVVSGTVIQALWANTTLSDVAQAVTDSLDRYGRGGMLAPFKVADGSPGSPGVGFTNEASTGIFRKSSGVMAFTILGTEVGTISAAGLAMPLNVTNLSLTNLTYTGTLTGSTGVLNIGAGQIYKDTSGNIGFGSVPAGFGATYRSLEVVGPQAGAGGSILRLANSNATTFLDLYTDAASALGVIRASGSLGLVVAGSERMRIDPSGYALFNATTSIGAGVTRMQVGSAPSPTSAFLLTGTSSSITLYAGSLSDAYLSVRTGNSFSIGHGPDNLSSFTSRLNIEGGGDIGIGAPVSKIGGARTLFVTPPDPATQDCEFHIRASGAFLRTNTTNAVPGGFGAYQHYQNGVLQFSVGNFGGGTGVLQFRTGVSNTERAAIDGNGVFTYGSREVGYRDVPRTTGFERGCCFSTTTSQTINTANPGNTFSIYNNSASAITLVQGGGVTLRLAGTTSTGNRTLAPRGLATIWFESSGEAIISGAGVS